MDKGTATLAPPGAAPIGVGLIVWLVLALALAGSGLLLAGRPVVPLTTVGLIAAGVGLHRRSGALRGFGERIDLRWLLLLQVTRAPIGALFLVEAAQGRIPDLFARNAGWGDIAVGVAALGMFFLLPVVTRARRRAFLVFTVLGIADLVVAFGTAQYLFVIVGDPRMAVVGSLPYGLLPTFAVPLIILGHLLLWKRVRACTVEGHRP
jgi:hypothetical protein